MNNEIKAILIQNGEPTPKNPIGIKRLLVNKEAEDYITNLQEENERLKRLAEKDYTELNIAEMNATIYKSRCEKANNILKDTNVDMPGTLLIETIDYARHILNGGDE